MGDAIWSTPPGLLLEYPAGTFLRFCDNHGLLHVTGKPMWRSVVGGSRTYVERAVERVSGSVLRRRAGRARRARRRAASPSSRASVPSATTPSSSRRTRRRRSRCSPSPSEAEREILGAFTYQPNGVTLHTDASFMPDKPPRVGRLELVRRDRRRDQGHAHADVLAQQPAGDARRRAAGVRDAQRAPSLRRGIDSGADDLHAPALHRRGDRRAEAAPRDPGRRRHLVRRRLAALRLPRGRSALGGARRRVDGRRHPVGRRARREPHAGAQPRRRA